MDILTFLSRTVNIKQQKTPVRAQIWELERKGRPSERSKMRWILGETENDPASSVSFDGVYRAKEGGVTLALGKGLFSGEGSDRLK